MQELSEGDKYASQPPTGLHSVFSVRVVSLSLCHSRDNHKAMVLFTHSWGLFCGPAQPLVSLHATHLGKPQGASHLPLCALVDSADDLMRGHRYRVLGRGPTT